MDLLRVEDLDCGSVAGVGFTLADGECLCISGPSGAGKTRLLRALADLDPHSGRVWLGDAAREDFAPSDWRRRVLLVPSESHWWSDSVGVHFQERPSSEQMAALGLPAEALEWSVARLSAGERQRLGLLRAALREPQVLLLDEPTANLDTDNAARVEAWLGRLRREHGTGLLWVSHDKAQIARVADRHLRIEDGRLVAA